MNPSSQKSWYHFLAPKYWPLWFAFGLLRLLICLPYAWLIKIGAGLGFIARHLLKRRVEITRINLKLCLPEKTEIEREVLLKKNFANIGAMIFEVALSWWGSDRRVRKLMLPFEGPEHLTWSLNQGRGVLLVGGHFTTNLLAVRVFTNFCKPHIVYRPQNNKLFEWFDERARRRFGVIGITKYDVRGVIKNLKEKALVMYTPDQDVGREMSLFAPLFGVQAACVTGTIRFPKITGAVMLMATYSREANNKILWRFLPPFTDFPSDDPLADLTRVNQTLEQFIRACPEQYMWQHRRFKTRPEGEQPFY